MNGLIDNPMLQLGMGLLGGNYGPNSRAAFANAMKGGMLGLQQAGVSQARQAQAQAAQQRAALQQQQLLMQQAAAKRQKDEEDRMRQWATTRGLDPNMPEWALKAQYEAEVKSKFPGAQGFGTTVQYVYDRNLKQVLPAQASQAGGVFIVMPDGSKQPFDPARHELRKPFTMQNFGGFQAPFQPLSGQVGAGGGAPAGGAGPIPQPIVPPFVDAQGNAPSLAPDEVLSPQSQYKPAGMPPGSVANTPKPGEMPEFKGQIVTAQEQAKFDFEKKVVKPKIRRAAESAYRRTGNVQRAIEQARNNTSGWTTGMFGAVTKNIPGSPAHNLERSLSTIESNLGFDKLQDMRDNSPTGGALGQVSERELDLLKSAWASLAQSQDEKQFRENLAAIEAQYKASWDAVEKAYQEDYGEPLFPKGRPDLGAAGPQGSGMSMQQRAMQELQRRKQGAQ